MRQLRSIRRSLLAAMCALVQAFVHCRLDYCNSLLTGAADVQFKSIASVQIAATRLVSGARHHDHITPVLTGFQCARELWWCGSVLSLNGTAPGYLSELCVPVAAASGRQHLRSASTGLGLLQVPRARTMIGRRSFAVTGPTLWNSLPAALRRPEMTLHTFKRQLKAYRFHNVIWCIDGQTLSSVPSCRDLGVIISHNLKPAVHVAQIVTKAHQRANSILRSFVSRDVA